MLQSRPFGPFVCSWITYYWIVGNEVQLFGSMDAGAFCSQSATPRKSGVPSRSQAKEVPSYQKGAHYSSQARHYWIACICCNDV